MGKGKGRRYTRADEERNLALGAAVVSGFEAMRSVSLALVEWAQEAKFAGEPLEPTPERQRASEKLFDTVMKANESFLRDALGVMRRLGIPLRESTSAAVGDARAAASAKLAETAEAFPQDHPVRDRIAAIRAKLGGSNVPRPSDDEEIPS